MNQTYLLEWLDLLVTFTLNPSKTDVSEITTVQSKAIIEKTIEQTLFIQSEFKIKVFSLNKEKQIKIIVGNYHSSLIIFLDNVIERSHNVVFERFDLKQVINTLISCFDELLSFIETRFSDYLSLDLRVPATYLLISKKKLKQKIDKLKNSSTSTINNQKVTVILFDSLYSFVNSKRNEKVTFRQVLYRKQLIKELELLKVKQNEDQANAALDEILIYMNFNSRKYINYFTKCVADKINCCESAAGKMENLLFYFKEFNQIHSKDGVILNPHHQDLKTVLSDWFKHEMMYLEKKLHFSVVPLLTIDKKQNQTAVIDITKDKVLCKLSTDQTALILRASDELKILIAKSMNHVFKTIVPFLSTPHKVDPSYDSMRSKSYVAEERDKKIVIETLERMIKQIKEY
ncbi:hypothetical protein [Flavobacterium xinjiangense]|uniref:Uncharacterized protein n=1 Tax=Flavobacterium xinjiangense TaxID=178356 RepID=A0A1M7PBW6_9FLAO|nr:hypothetical protein [Flavobacterium xinjiangense]SHN13859.1 hypothetical protein SAMN05216269_11536 [Flavobacterium xinjiangense]